MDFWNSPEQLGKINQSLQFALVVFGVITGLIGAASFVVGHRKDSLLSAREIHFKQQVKEIEKRTSDVRPLQGRRLTKEQKGVLSTALSNMGPVQVLAIRHNSKESQQYSSEIEAALKEAGWTVEHFLPMTRNRDACGACIGLNENINSLPAFDALKETLAVLGLEFEVGVFQGKSKYQISLDAGIVRANDYQSLIDRIN